MPPSCWPAAEVLEEYDHDPRTPEKLFDQASGLGFAFSLSLVVLRSSAGEPHSR